MIRMIRGVFGLPVNGIVKPMDKNSGAFHAGAEQEERLIRLGLAVKVEVEGEETAPTTEDVTTEETTEEPVDLNTLSVKALREIGKQYGLTFKVGMSKDEIVAAITTAKADAVEVEDGEPAPVFDAAEAVQ